MKCREVRSVTVIPIKLVLLVMGGHCCFSPLHQKTKLRHCFWVMAPSNLVDRYRRFGDANFFVRQCGRWHSTSPWNVGTHLPNLTLTTQNTKILNLRHCGNLGCWYLTLQYLLAEDRMNSIELVFCIFSTQLWGAAGTASTLLVS